MIRIGKTFCALLQRDIVIFWSDWKNEVINGLAWGILTVAVFEYIMPAMGSEPMGQFISCVVIVCLGFFQITENATKFVADLEGEHSISYYLTLPMPQWMIFSRFAIINALKAMFVSLWFLPIFKFVLGDAFSFSHFSYGKFIIIFLLIHLFYGFFSLYLAAKMKSLDEMGNLWWRIIFPLRWIGCFQFKWKALQLVSPQIAFLDLFNPIVYCMEGIRVSIMGQEGFINFWFCCGALIVFTVIAGVVGIEKLKIRLDCL